MILETFGALATILSSSGFGAIIGGVFSWLNRKEDRKDRESDRDFKLNMVRAGSKAMTEQKEADAFLETQKTKSKISDTIKAVARPAITGVLLYQTYLILTGLETLTGGLTSLDPNLTVDLYQSIVLNIISLTATAVSWWFGSRSSYHSVDNPKK